MEGCSHKSLAGVIVAVVGFAGVLLCLVGPMASVGAQDVRSLQLWPDRSIGVSSGLWEGSAVHADAQVLPFGVFRTPAGDIVRAHTYLHFPLDVFPPGTEILHATLYVYVDSGAGGGEATWGAYRVLEPWEEGNWSGDPATWPALLPSPIAAAAARFDVMTPLLVSTPTSTAAPTAAPSPTPTSSTSSLPALTSLLGDTSPVRLASTPPTSPLSTPPTSPLSTPTPLPTSTTAPSSATPTSTPSGVSTLSPPTPMGTPAPTLDSSSPVGVPVVALGRVAETWLTWDVTALMRAWMVGEVPDDGLALAPAPDPDADPETAGDLLVARQIAADDPDTRPYLIVEFEVHPVTATPVPVLPAAGKAGGWGAGLPLVGAALLLLLVGLIVRRR